MYAFIRGTLVQINEKEAVLDVNGIGYQIHTPSNLSAPEIGSEFFLYTSFIVREGFQGLYGFPQEAERNLFNEVIEISGIGPKTALCLLSHFSLSNLRNIIEQEDAVALSKVPGIGKKTAERLLIELRNKLEKFFLATPLKEEALPKSTHFSDALKALINLGYNRSAAQKALKKSLEASADQDLSSLISSSLKHAARP